MIRTTVSDENQPRAYKVRGGFTMHRGDNVHRAGETVTLLPAEAALYAHQIEPVEDAASAYVEPKISPDQRKKTK